MAVSLRRALLPSICLGACLVSSLAAALPPPGVPATSAATPTPVPVEVSPESPRSSVTQYLKLANKGDWEGASNYLDWPPGPDAPLLARQLKAVLDRHLYVRLEELSPHAEGFEDDSLPPGVDQLGTIPGSHEQPEPVRIVRKDRPAGAIWLFSRATLNRVPGWYSQLPDRHFRETLPGFFFRMGPKGLVLWQWLAILGGFPLLLLGGRAVAWAVQRLLLRAARKTETTWDDALAARVSGPFSLAGAIFLGYILAPFLEMNETGYRFTSQVLAALAIFTFFWIAFRIVAVASDILSQSEWARTNPSAPAILSLGVRGCQITLIILGALAGIAQLGFPVGSALAGLGLGGLAIALAAQKTVENLFGSISIGVDQPFRVGDFVNIGGILGTVEAIGLRSTRVRTLDRTIVTIPNGKLADREIETFGLRDRFRLIATIGVEYGTTAAQLRAIIDGLQGTLANHPKIWPDEVIVKLLGFGESAINIEVAAWFLVKDMLEFRAVRQEVLLGFMDVIEKEGSSFAFPSRTVYLRNGPEAAR
ncbi:MAG: hypothetical protein DIJKHBIC_04120 [Thermoanaerobaculia bacterium]|nr:hypothetical protein [Thermoanaerobaculia bacterium]